MRPGEMAAFPGPGAFFIHILCGCQMLQGSRHHSTWSDYVVQRPKTNKKICSLKSLIFIEGIMEKMTVFKSLCSVCQPGGGSGKVGWSGVDWLQRSWKSHPGQSPCDSSRVSREDAICHHLAGFGHQGTEWAIVLDFGGRSWRLT